MELDRDFWMNFATRELMKQVGECYSSHNKQCQLLILLIVTIDLKNCVI